LDKDKFFDSKISLFLTLRSVYNYNNSFGIEKENIYNVNTTNDFLCLNNDDIGQIFSLFQENLSTNDEETNPDRIHFIPSLNKNTTNLNMNKEINIKSLDTDKSKSNELLEIKKELPPKFFPETSINVIIKNYYVNKELKLNLLFDSDKTFIFKKIKEKLFSDKNMKLIFTGLEIRELNKKLYDLIDIIIKNNKTLNIFSKTDFQEKISTLINNGNNISIYLYKILHELIIVGIDFLNFKKPALVAIIFNFSLLLSCNIGVEFGLINLFLSGLFSFLDVNCVFALMFDCKDNN